MKELILLWSLVAALLAYRHSIRRRARAPKQRLRLAVGHSGGPHFYGVDMAALKSNQILPLSISPAEGEVPAEVTDVQWSVSDPLLGAVNTTSPDMHRAVFVPADDAQGSVTVTVSAKNVLGQELSETVDIEIERHVPVADRLNLVVGEPEAK